MTSRRPPYSSAGKNASGGCVFDAVKLEILEQGEDLYRSFNSFSATGVMKVRHCRTIPPVVVELGELVGLIYRSDKGQPGQPFTYIHRMEDPPRLVCNSEGTQLYIIGGSYRVTAQGIEG
ncbi:hypothetical protein QZJ86_10240 [Methylomonas montana]|uniref:hypothetical protein n=1 Tax=Methylomonas montana TaxID=3058963 RepID=UPI00265B101B|nr:hypothetical protein [Methylomonas montana]WKJ92498.1 hypothetical protein QZJ86_10240 [Methylomonas montana]